MAQHEAGDDRARLAQILSGLRKFQAAERPPPPPPVPVVASAGRARLFDYGGPGPAAVFMPSLINSSTILDLAENNSMLRWLSGQGIRPLLVDWGTPDPADHAMDIGGHVTALLQPLLHNLGGPYHLIGYCLGGTMAVASAALSTPLSLTLIATPWNFDGFTEDQRDTLQTLWESAQPTVEALGLLPLEILQIAFWLLDPERTVSKYARFGTMTPGSTQANAFIRVEDWVNGGAPLTRAAARELVDDLFTVNVTGDGRWQVGGVRVDPAALGCPVRQIVSTIDRIVPAASALAGDDRLDLALGHVGMIVGSRAKRDVWAPLAQRLSQSHTSW